MYEKFVCNDYYILVIIVPNVVKKKKKKEIWINVERPEYIICSLELVAKIHQINNKIIF